MPVVVGFWAEWCVPSRALEATFASAVARYGGRFRFVLVDADAQPRLAEAHAIAGLPTILLFRSGREQRRRVGLMGLDRLFELLDGDA